VVLVVSFFTTEAALRIWEGRLTMFSLGVATKMLAAGNFSSSLKVGTVSSFVTTIASGLLA